MYHSLDKSFWVTITFLPPKESHSVSDIDFFITPSFNLSELELLRIELTKLSPNILMKNCDHSICPG